MLKGVLSIGVVKASKFSYYVLYDETGLVQSYFNYNEESFNFDSRYFGKTTTFKIKGFNGNDCGGVLDSSFKTVYLGVNPKLEIGSIDSLICEKQEGQIYVANTEKGVWYQLKNKWYNKIGVPVIGNGGTIVLKTGSLFETSQFYINGLLNGCSTDMENNVKINVSKPRARFTVDDFNPSLNQTVNVYNTAKMQSYSWSFGPNASYKTSSLEKSTPRFFSIL